MNLSSFLKTVSVQQTKEVEKKLQKLKVIKRDYDIAINKDVLKNSGLEAIAEIDIKIHK